jgi:hypothetical protein
MATARLEGHPTELEIQAICPARLCVSRTVTRATNMDIDRALEGRIKAGRGRWPMGVWCMGRAERALAAERVRWPY